MQPIQLYILVDGIPQTWEDGSGWKRWMKNNDEQCVVASDRLVAGSGHRATLTTVFCGFDPHRSLDQALLYETLILHDKGDLDAQLPSGSAKRTSTELEAQEAHALALSNLAEDGFYPFETEAEPELAAEDAEATAMAASAEAELSEPEPPGPDYEPPPPEEDPPVADAEPDTPTESTAGSST